MYEAKEGRAPRSTHYVSNSNGRVYPALRNVPGFEDDNPNDWRAATQAEIEAYERGDAPALAPKGEVQLSAPVQPSVPSTITLAEDDEPAQTDPPPAPPAALAGVTPAFQIPQA